MHSIVFTIAVVMVLVAHGSDLASLISLPALAVIVAALVALIGLPHGALDHRTGQRLFGSGRAALATFFATYLGIMAMVVVGWYVAPALTVLTFFILSAWHFGLEEDDRDARNVLQFAAMVARGGMVIWVPMICQPDAIQDLLSMIVPAGDARATTLVISLIQASAPVLIVLTAIDALTYGTRLSSSGRLIRPNLMHLGRVTSLALLFATVHPLAGFGIYFCGWHSVRGLAHLREEFGDQSGSLVTALIPMTLGAIVIAGVGWLVWQFSVGLTPALIRTTFVGLSAVAIPHLILHIVADRQSRLTWQSQGVAA